ncbi:uncharacterized protein B0I36DRAFT_247446 [Microdochium trichocladiopsis]|uniref:Uncharacterized protein n=1 Tax=Microdochium trichocladiopsis TaxID=1682393 RepID=A0A9P9BNU3_9PEZI|nr:uncharacterized protein B0I36DRAFT_247446 [Microdochium trichocladiopsis]KAH7028088.1 hypothetical protein B0I36DRAFT_247446 [Microdochium trichocladiopsis]
MDSEQTPGVYPGLGLPIEYDNTDRPDRISRGDYYPIGARGEGSGAGTTYDILPVREVAMMLVMDRLTDKPNWHKKIFDDEITAKWRAEALAWPDDDLWSRATRGKSSGRFWGQEAGDETGEQREIENILNDECFDFVLGELRKKAEYFEKTRLIPTLDVGPAVVKSDTLVPPDLHEEIRKAFDTLRQDQSANPDWHPGTNEQVRNLIHPSMYPLVYNVTKAIQDEVVGVDDAITKWSGKGEIITGEIKEEAPPQSYSSIMYGNRGARGTWSHRFQWLPSNLHFNEDGSVRFTSYINGLHPEKYTQIYRTLERLVDKAIPAWDQCVCEVQGYEFQAKGRSESRIELGNYCDTEENNWSPNAPPPAEFIASFDKTQIEDFEELLEDEDEEQIAEEVWKHIRKPVQPAPKPHDFDSINYTPDPSTTLFAKYRATGLQIIVKMASIELSPENDSKADSAEFPLGSWHVEGQMNERIVGTALFYSDCENITDSSLEFRAQTAGTYLHDSMESVGQDSYHWMQSIFGTQLGSGNAPGIQNWGDVETKQGRLLAFPNIFQHRVRPFQLRDPTKPGYRRFVALWLVDPSTRIISTANVPPQRQDWWIESILGQTIKPGEPTSLDAQEQSSSPKDEMAPESTTTDPNLQAVHDLEIKAPFLAKTLREKLPAELFFDVSKRLADTKSLPMSEEEAKGYRLELMKARSMAKQEIEDTWQSNTYSFCEH